MVVSRSIDVGSVLGMTMGVEELSTLVLNLISLRLSYQGNVDQGGGLCCLMR